MLHTPTTASKPAGPHAGSEIDQPATDAELFAGHPDDPQVELIRDLAEDLIESLRTVGHRLTRASLEAAR